MKKQPTTEQIMQYRQMQKNAYCQADYDQIHAFEQEYDISTKIFEKNGKRGVKDAAGEILLPAKYDDVVYTFVDSFRHIAHPVIINNKVALIKPDGKGTPITGFDYDFIVFSDGYYLLVNGDKKGLATSSGHIIVPAEMDEVFLPMNNLVMFSKDGKIGFTMLDSDVITETIYDNSELDEGEYLIVVKDGVSGYIDINGHFTEKEDEKYFHARAV